MSDLLRVLRPEARRYLAPESYLLGVWGDLTELTDVFEAREIDLRPLEAVIAEAMKRFNTNPVASDGWLAPRVHATLRLWRREAVDPAVWGFLALRFREYVLWRWGRVEGTEIGELRISGSTRRQALARLWWLAELTRQGADYSATEPACRAQEMTNWLLDVRAFQHPVLALAYVRFFKEGEADAVIRATAKALNHALTTIAIDAIAPTPEPGDVALAAWVRTSADETLMLDTLPVGPEDREVSESSIVEAVGLFKELAGAVTA